MPGKKGYSTPDPKLSFLPISVAPSFQASQQMNPVYGLFEGAQKSESFLQKDKPFQVSWNRKIRNYYLFIPKSKGFSQI